MKIRPSATKFVRTRRRRWDFERSETFFRSPPPVALSRKQKLFGQRQSFPRTPLPSPRSHTYLPRSPYTIPYCCAQETAHVHHSLGPVSVLSDNTIYSGPAIYFKPATAYSRVWPAVCYAYTRCRNVSVGFTIAPTMWLWISIEFIFRNVSYNTFFFKQ